MKNKNYSYYEKERKRIKSRIRNLHVTVFLLIPILGYVIYVGEINQLVVSAVLIWFVLFFITFWGVFLLVCPNCGALIFMNGMLSFGLKKCNKCGFALEEPKVGSQ